jgi:hypothetical protein
MAQRKMPEELHRKRTQQRKTEFLAQFNIRR